MYVQFEIVTKQHKILFVLTFHRMKLAFYGIRQFVLVHDF